jgi:hypothetical protein
MASVLWRRVLQATIDSLRGVSKGQYDLRLGRPKGIEAFFAGLPRVANELGGYDVKVPLAEVHGTYEVPAMELDVSYIGPESTRKDWRVPSQRPHTAYPLWRLGVGLLETTEPGTDFVILVRESATRFHARWLRGEDVKRLPEALSAAMVGTKGAGVEEIDADDWPEVAKALDIPASGRDGGRGTRPKQPVGGRYRVEDENVGTAKRQPFDVDPDAVDRGLSGHRKTQNALARHLESANLDPLSPVAGDPPFDLAWVESDRLYVVEVKSVTSANEERQLRLGLGQVLRYAFQLRDRQERVIPVLAVERQPHDKTWRELCNALGVHLTWPEAFADLTDDSAP